MAGDGSMRRDLDIIGRPYGGCLRGDQLHCRSRPRAHTAPGGIPAYDVGMPLVRACISTAAILAAASGLAGTSAGALPPPAPWTITEMGPRQVLIAGVALKPPTPRTLSTLIQAWGPPAELQRPPEGASHCIARWDAPAVRVELRNYGLSTSEAGACEPTVGKVSEITTEGQQWRTGKGLRVGDTYARMRRMYPRSRIDEYYEGDHMPPTAVHYFWLRPYSTV